MGAQYLILMKTALDLIAALEPTLECKKNKAQLNTQTLSAQVLLRPLGGRAQGQSSISMTRKRKIVPQRRMKFKIQTSRRLALSV